MKRAEPSLVSCWEHWEPEELQQAPHFFPGRTLNDRAELCRLPSLIPPTSLATSQAYLITEIDWG